jgi:von Willebrand factor type A domain
MSSWIRRQFDSIGLTQSPPGPHLAALQARFGGTVLLCIDVSYSMGGEPLRQAVSGGQQFIDEAVTAHYRCGLVLWSHKVVEFVAPGEPEATVRATLTDAVSTGGTAIVPTLTLGKRVLGSLTGDRVMCIFSDSYIEDLSEAVALARELCAMGVRIVVRGLGQGATDALSVLTCPGERDDHQLIEHVKAIGPGIASMATGLTIRRPDRPDTSPGASQPGGLRHDGPRNRRSRR